jgi:tetratricopeptide (TPR) repeat protein
MTRLEQRHPGDRENSLYASVALSLRRLPPQLRSHLDVLAACHGAIHLAVLAELTEVDIDGAREMAIAVIGVGLGEDLGDGCLGLDPGLAPYLRGELDPTTLDELKARWAEATTALTEFLGMQQFQDAGWAARVTLRQLPELLALLDWTAAHQPPEQVVALAARIEDLVRPLGQPRVLAHAARIRAEVAAELGGWSRARYLAASAEIERLLDQGQWPAALDAAQQLLALAQAGGEGAFPEAAYDLATTQWRLGRVLRSAGAIEDALTPLREARRRFQQLAATGIQAADSMAGKTLAEIGDCLLRLGRWERAAEAHREAAAHATRLGDDRAAAVSNGQLAAVRLEQGRYTEALEGYTAAREAFQKLGEPRMVAVAWHQIGMVHQEAGQFEAAEQAYQHSLALEVQQNNQAGQADTLNQLGLLYQRQGRLEDAVGFHRQAVDIAVRSDDLADEGRGRYNLANTLLRLGRYDQARTELQRAVECDKPYGHAAEPWKTWELLEHLEHATGHPDAAHTARRQAIATYLAYRHAGGGSQNSLIELFDHVAQALTERTPDQATRDLAGLLEPDTPLRTTALVQILQALLAGDPEPARTDHPDLHPRDVAELHLLLESLATPPPEGPDG